MVFWQRTRDENRLKNLVRVFQFEGTYLSSISGSGDLVALKIFLLHLVFNLICINYANYNVKIDLIISKEIDQARTFLFYNLAVFMFSFIYFLICVCARVENRWIQLWMLAILSGNVYKKLIKSQKIPLLFELDILNILDQELGSCVNAYYIGLTVYFDRFFWPN